MMYDVISVISIACFALLTLVLCVGFIENCYDNWWWRRNGTSDTINDEENACEEGEENTCEEGEEITCEEGE